MADDQTKPEKAQNPYAVPATNSDVAQPPVSGPESNAAATAKAAALGDIVDRLTSVLALENQLLTQPKSSELGPVVARKQVLFIEYEQYLKENGDLKSLMAELPPSEKEALLARAKLFDQVLRENELKLDAMVKSSEHIMGVISEVARKAAQPVRGYGAAGTMNRATKTVAPVALNGTF